MALWKLLESAHPSVSILAPERKAIRQLAGPILLLITEMFLQ